MSRYRLFEPWKGEHYGSSSLFNIPILIVGESNYTENPSLEKSPSTFTQDLIKSIIHGSWKHRFFSNIQRSFVEHANTQKLRHEFWHSVAHHEYIQKFLPHPGVAPDEEMWTEAKPIFREVVAELQPQCILFVCKRVFHRVSQDFPHTDSLSIEENAIYRNPRPVLEIDSAIASYINHPNCPRGGFRRARPVVKSLIETAGGKACI